MQIREHLGSERPAVILHPSGTTVGFAELEARANRLAHYLRWAGLGEGDVIAAIMENNEHIHAVMWAARRAGLYYVLVNTHLTAPEAAYIIDNSGAKAVIGSDAMRDVCAGLASHLAAGLPRIRLIADGDLEGWQRYPDVVIDVDVELPTNHGDIKEVWAWLITRPDTSVSRPTPADHSIPGAFVARAAPSGSPRASAPARRRGASLRSAPSLSRADRPRP